VSTLAIQDPQNAKKSWFLRRIFLWAELKSRDIRTEKLTLVTSGPTYGNLLPPPNYFRFRDTRGRSRSIYKLSTPLADEIRKSVWTESLRIVTATRIPNFAKIASREVWLSQWSASPNLGFLINWSSFSLKRHPPSLHFARVGCGTPKFHKTPNTNFAFLPITLKPIDTFSK